MTWVEFLSMLGVTGVISAVIQHKWKKHIEATYNERLARLESVLEKKNYVSKVRFDAEFAIYRELSEVFSSMILDNNELFPLFEQYPRDPEEQKKCRNNRSDKACDTYNNAMILLAKNKPFILSDICDQFQDILKLCNRQIVMYRLVYRSEHYDNYNELEKCAMRQIDINSKMETIFEKLREYLKSLEVE